MNRQRVVATPGFQAKNPSIGLVIQVVGLLNNDGEPSWVVGDPKHSTPRHEDQGRTLKIPAPFRFWAIRDDYPKAEDLPEGSDARLAGQSVITFLLPEEY